MLSSPVQLLAAALFLAGIVGATSHDDVGSPSKLHKRAYRQVSRWETPVDIVNQFDFGTTDPSNGYVQYVDHPTARSLNMTGRGANGGLRFGADLNQTSGPKRSIRLESKATYGTGLYIFDLAHMPVGCGTWPALWTVTSAQDWPNGGEFDLVENVNGVTDAVNVPGLHTGPNCTVPANPGGMTGKQDNFNCNVFETYNAGCGVDMVDHPKSYGYLFNQNKGGVFAMQRTATSINVWFWSQKNAPAGTKRGDKRIVNIGSWGKPSGSWPFTASCTPDHISMAQMLIIDADFCGDYVKSRWDADGCSKLAPTCEEYISTKSSPEWYWDINSISIWTHY